MTKIRWLGVMLCLMGGVFPLMAATVTLSVVQNEQAPEIAIETSRTIEDQLFGKFFDSGHIVSNDDIRFDGSLVVEKKFGVKEAAFGMSEYLLVVSLTFGPGVIENSEKKISYAELRSITWRVVYVLSSKVLGEGTIDVRKIKIRDFDPNSQARLAADKVYSETVKLLKKPVVEGENK